MSAYCCSISWVWFFLVIGEMAWCVSSRIELGSRLVAKEGQAWVSDNGTFAFGFTPVDSRDQYQVAIWFAQLPGDRTVVWSANR
ncbi:G-type lectin S-receptor-like serine/threonine-protein kinase At5g24080 [Actinidia eriantha]|nr:G-type lectin S-receptor-like serine/threonine-protein kinase At5g24080 [Actinidia eriantha]